MQRRARILAAAAAPAAFDQHPATSGEAIESTDRPTAADSIHARLYCTRGMGFLRLRLPLGAQLCKALEGTAMLARLSLQHCVKLHRGSLGNQISRQTFDRV